MTEALTFQARIGHNNKKARSTRWPAGSVHSFTLLKTAIKNRSTLSPMSEFFDSRFPVTSDRFSRRL